MPQLCVIPGDGIGQEVIPAAVEVLKGVVPGLSLVPAEAGWDCFLRNGVSVPQATLQAVRSCGAALFGAVSSPLRKVEGYRSAILTLRQELDLFANLRPARSMPRVSPRPGVNLMVVRENTEGLYAGREHWEVPGEKAIAERVISRAASLRIGRQTAELAAALGRRRVTIVHKANVLPLTDGLFRDSVREALGTGLEVEELLVDVAAMRLASEPERFELLVTSNLFGDILSDITAVWCGGLGLAPSINWGAGCALAEPVHGSAPDIAGKGLANPLAAILSGALLVRFVWQDEAGARRIEQAVEETLAAGWGVAGSEREMATEKITRAVLERL